MAGAFQTVQWNTRHLEYNVKLDIPAAQKLAKNWPTPVVWSGFEIGVAAAFPHVVIEEDLNYIPASSAQGVPIISTIHRRMIAPPGTNHRRALRAAARDRGYF